MTPTTIDNLSIESHKRYAEDQKIHDPNTAQEAPFVAKRLEGLSTARVTEETFFELTRSSHLAIFCTPSAMNERKNVFFLGRIFPNIDTEELLHTLFQMNKDEANFWFEELNEILDQDNRMKKVIETLLRLLSSLNKDLKEIYSRFYEFQKT